MDNLRIFIKKIIKEELENNLSKLESIKTIDELWFFTKTLRKINSGYYRTVFNWNKDTVLKVLHGTEDMNQNHNEIKNSLCLGKKFAPQIFKAHPEGWWIISEKVIAVKSMEELDEKFSELGLVKQPFNRQYMNSLSRQVINAIEEKVNYNTKTAFDDNQWFFELTAKLKNCDVQSDDFHFKNWGIRPSTRELVILDLGF